MDTNKDFIVGIFGDEDKVLHASKSLREEKHINIHDVYTPYPVHGLEKALGYKESWMALAAFLFGATGTTLAITMQTLMLGVNWPMIIGGKPYIAVPDFVPVTFELTVLLAAFGMSFTFFIVRGLSPITVPRVFDRRSTDDKHVMAIDLADNKISKEAIKAELKASGAEEVFEKSFTDEENEGNFFNYLGDLFKNGVTSSSKLQTN